MNSTNETVRTSEASDSSFSWYFSDHGLGTSVDNDTETIYSSAENFEKQVCDLHALREKLLEEDFKLEVTLKEIAKGNQKIDSERLKHERTILSTTLKTRMLLSDFRQQYMASQTSTLCRIGSVTSFNVKLQHSPEYRSKKIKQYFLCSIARGCNLYLSQICEADKDGVIHFNINHTFINLPVDFEISLKIFVLRIKKKGFLKKLQSHLVTWFKRRNNVEPTNGNWRRESLFKFWKECRVNINNINRTNEFFLEMVNFRLCKLSITVAASIDVSSIVHKGWLDVSRNGLFWSQRWCVLKGYYLKCFHCPADEDTKEPVNVIDLNLCSHARIGRPIELRSRLIILEMDDTTKGPFYFYLATTSNFEFLQWKLLERLVPTLQRWKNVSLEGSSSSVSSI